MSEFKFACPVCGQHMKCDSAHGGEVMECPTCFQKITAPQAPASEDQKFIITGTKVGEKPVLNIPTDRVMTAPEKNFPMVAMIAVLVVVLAAGAALFVFRGKIFKSGGTGAPTNEVTSGSGDEPAPPKIQPPPKLPKPIIVAPPASDTNWMLALGVATIPGTPVAGRIHGQDFIVERTYFQNGTLTLRAGTRGPVESGCMINFGGALAEALAGQTINVTTNADKAARVTLRWKDGDQQSKDSIDSGYALRLEFGALANNRLPGKIYLCTPDPEKSYLMGTFNADARKPKPKPPKQ
jgi:hypothetical protein